MTIYDKLIKQSKMKIEVLRFAETLPDLDLDENYLSIILQNIIVAGGYDPGIFIDWLAFHDEVDQERDELIESESDV